MSHNKGSCHTVTAPLTSALCLFLLGVPGVEESLDILISDLVLFAPGQKSGVELFLKKVYKELRRCFYLQDHFPTCTQVHVKYFSSSG